MENWSFVSCEKLNLMTNWAVASVASAFFASLERCSCISISISDIEDEDEAKIPNCPSELPLCLISKDWFLANEKF
ncbi:hypothetical protein RJ641_016586 [Dillenia turbinata]|uniref:Uncharacterized protein n=1 Tax=Dillenia turbinata TaxID=194707 RepID=A0AAN8YWX6_9MAGN